jgi:hypothetical protein
MPLPAYTIAFGMNVLIRSAKAPANDDEFRIAPSKQKRAISYRHI